MPWVKSKTLEESVNLPVNKSDAETYVTASSQAVSRKDKKILDDKFIEPQRQRLKIEQRLLDNKKKLLEKEMEKIQQCQKEEDEWTTDEEEEEEERERMAFRPNSLKRKKKDKVRNKPREISVEERLDALYDATLQSQRQMNMFMGLALNQPPPPTESDIRKRKHVQNCQEAQQSKIFQLLQSADKGRKHEEAQRDLLKVRTAFEPFQGYGNASKRKATNKRVHFKEYPSDEGSDYEEEDTEDASDYERRLRNALKR